MILVSFFQPLFFRGPPSCKTESSSFLSGLSMTRISVTCKLTLTNMNYSYFYATRATEPRGRRNSTLASDVLLRPHSSSTSKPTACAPIAASIPQLSARDRRPPPPPPLPQEGETTQEVSREAATPSSSKHKATLQ